MTDFDLRLVAYKPNGDYMGVLTDAQEIQFGDILNDISALQFTYPSIGAHADWLNQPLEIAVEYWDGVSWTETNNGRVLVLEDSRNAADDYESWRFTCPGYAFTMTKALMAIGPSDRTKTGKRLLRGTPGGIIHSLVVAAKLRGALTGFQPNFDSVYDTSGTRWADDEDDDAVVELEFEAGTTVLDVLQALVSAGRCEWRMRGRELRMYNAANEMAQPRAGRSGIELSTTLSSGDFLNSYQALLTDGAIDEVVGSDVSRKWFMSAVISSAGGATPPDRLNRIWVAGTDGYTGRNTTLMYQTGTTLEDSDITRSFGAFVADHNTQGVNFVLALPDMRDESIALARQFLQLRPRSGVLLSGWRNTNLLVNRKANTYYTRALAQLASRGIAVIEVEFASDNSSLWQPGDHVAVTSGTYAGIGIAGIALLGGFQNRSVSAKAGSLVDNPGLGSASSKEFGGRAGSIYAKVVVREGWASTHMPAVAYAIHDALGAQSGNGYAARIKSLIDGRRIPFTKPKPRPEGYPPEEGRYGPVALLAGRDLLEAPTTRSRRDMVDRVFAYGDSWVNQVYENDNADLPWGSWEAAIAEGGVQDPKDLAPSVMRLLDQGISDRIQMTRGITLLAARWIPWQDYDCGDIVLTTGSDGDPGPARIQQLNLVKNSDGISGSIVMDDRFAPQAIRANQAIKAASGGSVSGIITGGSGTRSISSVADDRKPKPPTGVTI